MSPAVFSGSPTHSLVDACFARMLELVAALGATQMRAIHEAGRLVSTAWQAGGRLMIAKTHHCLHHEGIHRSSGPLGVEVLEDDGGFYECERLVNARSEDVVLIHVNSGTYGRSVGIALRALELGASTIGLTQLPYELDPSVPIGHPSGKRLSEVVDVVIDLGGDIGDGTVQLRNSDQTVAPSSGVTGILAFWMIVAAACDDVTNAGHTPLVLDSLLLAGARERNNEAVSEWQRTGLPFRPGSVGASLASDKESVQ